jgi:hypothetical protein
MNRRLGATMLCTAAALGAGCAVQGRPFEKVLTTADHAVIYVYRPYSYNSSLLRPPVTCGDETARIGPGGYRAFIVKVGDDVTCSVQGAETTDEMEIHARPTVYYIREQIGWGILTGHPQLNPIDTDSAQSEIQSCCVLEKR